MDEYLGLGRLIGSLIQLAGFSYMVLRTEKLLKELYGEDFMSKFKEKIIKTVKNCTNSKIEDDM